MNKNTTILIAAVVATLTLGAATFAVAGKAGYTCCSKPDRVCCQVKQACCK